jgi:hypothetical protein
VDQIKRHCAADQGVKRSTGVYDIALGEYYRLDGGVRLYYPESKDWVKGDDAATER